MTQGFLQFRSSGEKTMLDVDTLNQELQVTGADRMRHSMYPDESHGLIFDFDDGVIVDTMGLRRSSWKTVANQEGLKFPEIERPYMYDMMPERAVMQILHWTNDIKKARDISYSVALEYTEELKKASLLPGVENWLTLMNDFNIPCAVVSNLDRMTLNNLLERFDIRDKFVAVGASDDDMENKAQQYLSAAIQLKRPPEQCVAFVTSQESIAAAHNCTMRAVAVIGRCTAPQLRAADLTVGSLDEMSVYNIRRLFSNRGNEFMDLNKKRAEEAPLARKLRNGTMDEL